MDCSEAAAGPLPALPFALACTTIVDSSLGLVQPAMIVEYVQAALDRARYELIDDAEPYYGEIPDLPGVWASGRTLEECRRHLAEVLDGWIVVRLGRGLPIPPLGGHAISKPESIEVNAHQVAYPSSNS